MSKKKKNHKKSDEKFTNAEKVLLITAIINLIESVIKLIASLLD